MNQSDAAAVASYLTHMTAQGLGSQESRESLLRVVAHLNAQIARMNQPLFNPPAFPRDHAQDGHNGMDLRDYFAAKALQAFISEQVEGIQEALFQDLDQETCEVLAKSSYLIADAMLKERDK